MDSGHVFTRLDGHPIEPATLTRHFNALLRQAHLRQIRFHGLRHSTAILLPEQGVELVVIKELLGHAHIGVTATVYANSRELHLMGVKLQVARSERRFMGTPSRHSLAS